MKISNAEALARASDHFALEPHEVADRLTEPDICSYLHAAGVRGLSAEDVARASDLLGDRDLAYQSAVVEVNTRPVLPFNRAATPRRAPGVVAMIVSLLRAASPTKPASRKAISAILAKEYPDRSPEALMSTVKGQVPGHLSEAGFNVRQNGDGFWIED